MQTTSAPMGPPTIGILAGMGPYSTAPFLELVLAECRARYGARHDVDYPPIQILSWPVPFYADRPVDEREIEEATCEGVRRLARAGASFIGVACNTAHAFFPSMAAASPVPLLDMVGLAADAAPSTPSRFALIAARPTVESGIYARALEARGHEVASPEWQEDVDRLIDATRVEDGGPERQRLWQVLADAALASRCDGLLLACADLTGVRGELRTALPVLDSTRLLAGGLVDRWLAERGRPA